MKFTCFAVALASTMVAAKERSLGMMMGMASDGKGMRMMGISVRQAQPEPISQLASNGDNLTYLDLRVYNIAYIQPFSPFFVMVHNGQVEPLFQLGMPPSEPLSLLAENGSPTELANYYSDMDGVFSSQAFEMNAPTTLGEALVIPIAITPEYPYVTIASMFVNSNDGFVAINGMAVKSGDRIYSPGYDAGSEENNELCSSMPGPACPSDSGNVRSGNGEGYVHIHRGFQGVGDLPATNYDWRNPMMLVVVE